MVFNSIVFAIFLPIVFAIYWSRLCNTPRKRNVFIVLSGFVFYGWWDVRFLGLMIATAMIDYYVTKGLEKAQADKKRKLLLSVSLVSNLGILFFFKYFNFFSESFSLMLSAAGMKADFFTLNVVLPVGISFYTFQALSYTIDVYKRRIAAAPDPVTYMAYISFFPQLVAGPIERATHLMPQFGQLHPFSYSQAVSGLRLMLWGYIKKCAIADNLAPLADAVFKNDSDPNGLGVFVGTVAFAIQAYGDFSGYSDIAKGAARLFGFELVNNFRFPYFASSMRDYWQRWHISMSYWFRDYVYIPLGGSRKGFIRGNVNILITFVLSGLWHGAAWTYVMWGVVHGIAQNIENAWKHFRGFTFPKVLRHLLVLFAAWGSYIYLRSPDIATANSRIVTLFTGSWSTLDLGAEDLLSFQSPLFIIILLVTVTTVFITEWLIFSGRVNTVVPKSGLARYVAYYLIVMTLLMIGVFSQPPAFIYFQF